MREGIWRGLVGAAAGALLAGLLTAFSGPAQVCESYDGKHTACAPISDRHGKPIEVYEDGSATYADGFVYDPETGEFERR